MVASPWRTRRPDRNRWHAQCTSLHCIAFSSFYFRMCSRTNRICYPEWWLGLERDSLCWRLHGLTTLSLAFLACSVRLPRYCFSGFQGRLGLIHEPYWANREGSRLHRQVSTDRWQWRLPSSIDLPRSLLTRASWRKIGHLPAHRCWVWPFGSPCWSWLHSCSS